jgi:hypothetical protein
MQLIKKFEDLFVRIASVCKSKVEDTIQTACEKEVAICRVDFLSFFKFIVIRLAELFEDLFAFSNVLD